MLWLIGTGIFVLPIGLALWTWHRNRRLDRRLYEHACPLCGSRFDDNPPSVIGPVSRSERAILDKFQKRFAGSTVRCVACGGYVLCSREGFPMRGYYLKEDA